MLQPSLSIKQLIEPSYVFLIWCNAFWICFRYFRLCFPKKTTHPALILNTKQTGWQSILSWLRPSIQQPTQTVTRLLVRSERRSQLKGSSHIVNLWVWFYDIKDVWLTLHCHRLGYFPRTPLYIHSSSSTTQSIGYVLHPSSSSWIWPARNTHWLQVSDTVSTFTTTFFCLTARSPLNSESPTQHKIWTVWRVTWETEDGWSTVWLRYYLHFRFWWKLIQNYCQPLVTQSTSFKPKKIWRGYNVLGKKFKYARPHTWPQFRPGISYSRQQEIYVSTSLLFCERYPTSNQPRRQDSNHQMFSGNQLHF